MTPDALAALCEQLGSVAREGDPFELAELHGRVDDAIAGLSPASLHAPGARSAIERALVALSISSHELAARREDVGREIGHARARAAAARGYGASLKTRA